MLAASIIVATILSGIIIADGVVLFIILNKDD